MNFHVDNMLSKMAPIEMAASLLVLRIRCSIFLCIISYIVSSENLKCYYIQPGRTIGYQRDVNLPAQPVLQPGIRLSQSESFVCTSQGIWTDSRGRSKTTRRRGCRNGLLVRLWMRTHHPPLPEYIPEYLLQSLVNKVDKIRARVAFQKRYPGL